jgi:hypothetical protein
MVTNTKNMIKPKTSHPAEIEKLQQGSDDGSTSIDTCCFRSSVVSVVTTGGGKTIGFDCGDDPMSAGLPATGEMMVCAPVCRCGCCIGECLCSRTPLFILVFKIQSPAKKFEIMLTGQHAYNLVHSEEIFKSSSRYGGHRGWIRGTRYIKRTASLCPEFRTT